MKHQIPLFASAAVAAAADVSVPSAPGVISYVVPTAFPTTVYSSYYGETLMMRHHERAPWTHCHM